MKYLVFFGMQISYMVVIMIGTLVQFHFFALSILCGYYKFVYRSFIVVVIHFVVQFYYKPNFQLLYLYIIHTFSILQIML